MAKLEFAFWDAVGRREDDGDTMAEVYDFHIRLA